MTATNKCYNFVGFRCRVPLMSNKLPENIVAEHKHSIARLVLSEEIPAS